GGGGGGGGGAAGGVEGVAVEVAGAGVDRIGEDAVDDRGGPQPPAAARPPRAGRQALADLADGQVLVDQPAVEQADDLGLGLVDQQVAGGAVALGDVAVAVGDLAGGPLPGAGLLELAAAEALAQDGTLVRGDGALDLEQELVVGVVGDGALDEGDRAAGLAQFFEEKDLVGVLAGQAVG